MIQIKELICFVMILFMAGCVTIDQASSKKSTPSRNSSAPDLSLDYPESQYLRTTASGQTEMEAKRLAIAELSNIFEARVNSDVSSSVKSVMKSGSEEEVTRTAQQSVRVISDLKLKGVKIGETWYDDGQRLYNAVAVLDRFQAKDNWSQELADLDGRAVAAKDSIKLQKSEFSKLQKYKEVRGLWLQRQVIMSRLRVLGFGKVFGAPYNIKEIFSSVEQIKAGLLIYIDAGKGKFAKLTVGQVTESLGKKGFTMTRKRSQANIFVNGSISVDPVNLPGKDFEFARANASFSIVDAETGLTVGKVNENKRSGHLNYSEAANKAIRKVSKTVSDKLVAYFSD